MGPSVHPIAPLVLPPSKLRCALPSPTLFTKTTVPCTAVLKASIATALLAHAWPAMHRVSLVWALVPMSAINAATGSSYRSLMRLGGLGSATSRVSGISSSTWLCQTCLV